MSTTRKTVPHSGMILVFHNFVNPCSLDQYNIQFLQFAISAFQFIVANSKGRSTRQMKVSKTVLFFSSPNLAFHLNFTCTSFCTLVQVFNQIKVLLRVFLTILELHWKHYIQSRNRNHVKQLLVMLQEHLYKQPREDKQPQP